MPPGIDHRTLFAPRAIALVGASRRPGSVGNRALRAVRRLGFAGEVFAIRPDGEEIEGIPIFPTLGAAPSRPDLIVALRPPEETIATVREAAELGVPWVLAAASGFEARPDLEAALARAAGERVGVIGPNTEGLWDLGSKLVASFGTVARDDDLFDGPAAVISQSGGVGAAMARRLLRGGIGCRTFVGTGNELNTTATELFAALVDRGTEQLLALYIEAVADLAALRDQVARATAAGIVVAVTKVGRSRGAAEAAASHSGRLAGDDALYRAALKDAGAVLVDSLDRLEALAQGLRSGRPAGPGIGVVAVSGGTRAMLYDAFEEAENLGLARFGEETVAAVAAILPDYAVPTNPVDVTGAVLGEPELLDRCVRAVAADEAVAGVLVQLGNTQPDGLPDWLTSGPVDFGGKPVWVSTLRHPDFARLARRVPSLPEPSLAVWALDALATPPGETGPTIGAEAGARVAAAPRREPPRTFAAGAALLAAVGIATPRSPVVDEALAAVPSVPAIVKTGNLAIHHKLEAGGIVTGVRSAAAAREAAAKIRAALGDLADPVLAQEMVPHERELILAVQARGERFLVVGGGGTGVEARGDVAVCLLPATEGSLERALAATVAGASLDADERRAVVAAAAGLARLQAGLACAELEINPLVVVDGRPVALDLLVGHEDGGT